MMMILNQYDPKWASVKMSPSSLTLGRFGCTTTAICMLSDYFKCFVLPPQAVNVNIKYTADGLIIWENIKFDRFKFEKRLRSVDVVAIDESLKDPSKAVIFNINHGAHWVTGVKKDVFGNYVIYDPWGGVKRTIKLNDIVGSAHLISI